MCCSELTRYGPKNWSGPARPGRHSLLQNAYVKGKITQNRVCFIFVCQVRGKSKPNFEKRGGFKGKINRKPKPEFNPDDLIKKDEIRLNKYIASSGICSRREADNLISQGLITVNGKVVTELGTKISPKDEVRYGDEIEYGPDVCWEEIFFSYSREHLFYFRDSGLMDDMRPFWNIEQQGYFHDNFTELIQRCESVKRNVGSVLLHLFIKRHLADSAKCKRVQRNS